MNNVNSYCHDENQHVYRKLTNWTGFSWIPGQGSLLSSLTTAPTHWETGQGAGLMGWLLSPTLGQLPCPQVLGDRHGSEWNHLNGTFWMVPFHLNGTFWITLCPEGNLPSIQKVQKTRFINEHSGGWVFQEKKKKGYCQVIQLTFAFFLLYYSVFWVSYGTC